jgi:tRNA U38,U39,U40 pseudouridine synthase TruA
MNEAMLLFNHIDFQCFSKVNTDVNTFDCTIFEASWKQNNNRLILRFRLIFWEIWFVLLGTLVNVGLNKITLDDFNAIIVHKNRDKAGFSVPAHGLYWLKLNTIIYKINGCKTICKLGIRNKLALIVMEILYVFFENIKIEMNSRIAQIKTEINSA